ncbi:DsbA family protein [Candidatus Falkowbacteria bacterium]|nr:DsbA family protein [Candidatus Falkowbacteria bacterium]
MPQLPNHQPVVMSEKHWLVWLFIIGMFIALFILLKLLMPTSPAAFLNTAPTTLNETSGFYTTDRQLAVEGSPMPWNVAGSLNPQVTIVEFMDFTCIHCLASWPALRQLTSLYPNIKVIMRNRTPSIRSLNLALAAHCAGEQGRYWEIHDKFFANATNTLGTDIKDILDIASQINLDRNAFTTCLQNRKYLDQIKLDTADATTLSINGTPTWFINGTKLEGELTIDDFKTIIDPLIN